MKHTTRIFACLLLSGLCSAVPAQADQAESYGDIVGRKVASGFGNIVSAPAEIPKNVIIVNNESNFAYGFVGGTFKGIFLMAGRVGVGLLDLLTAPIPTYPIVDPLFVWDDFYAETTFGPAMVPEPANH
ncbi:MAG: exosortase system-associated protein, TIGR04073 family [Gammaproteobacteria bacterium]